MKKALITIALSLHLLIPAHAHNGTEAWLKDVSKTAKIFQNAVKNETINFKWAPDGKFLFVQLKNAENQAQWHRYDLATGKDEFIEKLPEIIAKKPASKEESEVEKPARAWNVEVNKRQITFKSKEETVNAPDTFLPEGSYWTKDQNWSPDGASVVLWHNTSLAVHQIHYVQSSPDGQIQPKHFTRSYPKAGDELNIPRPVIFFTGGQAPIALDDKLAPTPFEIRNARWSKDSKRFTVEYIERGFGKYQIIEINTETKKQRVLVSEESDKFIHVYGNSLRRDLDETNEILWLSERSGYNHLYLIDALSGEVKKQLTDGQWIVRDVVEVDEDKREALIQISGYYSAQDPYYLHFARLDLDSGNLTHIAKLQGALMLTVGEVDTNVDPSSTMQVVNGLIKNDKDFVFYLVPNGNHGIGESPYLRRKRIEFFQKNLQ